MFKLVEHELPYCRAVGAESLRLHPSVPKDIKFAINDDMLPDGTPILKGQAVCYCPYAMGRDPTIWPEPLLFKPERWMGSGKTAGAGAGTGAAVSAGPGGSSSLHVETVSEYKYPVFNAGPRLCLGRPLALLEIQLGLALIFDQFDLAHPAGANPDDASYLQSLVCPRKNGLQVTAKQRVR
jgi:fatty acid omega-hydroxylase